LRFAARDPQEHVHALSLSALLARTLLGFTFIYERDADISLAIAANALRLTPARGVATSELPRKAGVSKEAIAMATGFLERHGYARVERPPGGAPKRSAPTIFHINRWCCTAAAFPTAPEYQVTLDSRALALMDKV
jgi:hypothetical protein